MPFKPNYRQARGDRDRAKQNKKQEKLRKREEDAARRKAENEPGENGVEAAEADSAVLGDGADSPPSDDASAALTDTDR